MNIIKYHNIILDAKTAYLAPFMYDSFIRIGDKNGKYVIKTATFNKMPEVAWHELEQLIYPDDRVVINGRTAKERLATKLQINDIINGKT